uniref:olfactory receptor class A-like protein 1 n=1 Tax=Jaculus jaculus TaxID=51337 RepID=UPI001E1AFDA3|nr:olfactory receptor class A-like protein 1 [Jaculus jaculus]
MLPRDLISGFFLILEIVIGFVGNSLIFVIYMYTFLVQPHLKKPIDVIFTHLTLANVLSIVFRLTPDVMSSFSVRLFLHDVGCKAVLYAYSVTRGLSICTTSLLSVFQAITLMSSSSSWAWLKSKVSSCIFPSFLFFWIINMSLFVPIIETVKAQSNFTVGSRYLQTHCQSNQIRYHTTVSFLSAIMIRDFLSVAIMMWASLYMAILLFGHNSRTRHVHSSSSSSYSSSEHKATLSILLLVASFIFFYCCNNFITFYLFYRPKRSPLLDRISGILSSCYSIICPYVLVNNRKIISKLISSCSGLKKFFSARRFNA